jgi:hypothetical protein
MISRRSATQRRSEKRSAPGTPPPGTPTSSSAALEPHLTANRENQAATPLIRPPGPSLTGCGARAPLGTPTSSSAAPEWPTGHIPQATDPNALIRNRPPAFTKKTFGETFGAATGVSAPSYRRNHGSLATSFKHPIRNHQSVGKAATVAGDVGPGFHTWPPGHIPQDNGCETADSQPVPSQKVVRRNVRRRDRGQRPQQQKKPWPLSHFLQTPNTKPPTRRQSRHCSWGRWPRFPHLASRPHPSR